MHRADLETVWDPDNTHNFQDSGPAGSFRWGDLRYHEMCIVARAVKEISATVERRVELCDFDMYVFNGACASGYGNSRDL